VKRLNRLSGVLALLVVLLTASLPIAALGIAGADALTPRCGAAQLHVWDRDAEGAAVDGGMIIRLRNVSQFTCTLLGYASVQGVDQWNGTVFTAARTRDSYLGGWLSSGPLPVVTLRAHGGVGSFLVDFVTGDDIHACPYLNTLKVKVPGSASVIVLTSTRLQACKDFQVHPFVPGASGSRA